MKKFLGPLISIVTGALTFVFLSLHFLMQKASGWVDGTSYSNAWELIKNADKDIDGSIFFQVMTIIVIVLASVLILYGLVYLLANLKVFKTKLNLKVLNDVLLGIFVVVTVVQLMALVVLANTLTGEILGQKVTSSPAVGMWLNLGLSVVACLLSIFFTKPLKNSKKK